MLSVSFFEKQTHCATLTWYILELLNTECKKKLQCFFYLDLWDLKSGPGDRVLDQYKATYNRHHHAHQPQMFNTQVVHNDGQLDQLQREFLDSTQREFYNLD